MAEDSLKEKINTQVKVIQEKLEATEEEIDNFKRILEISKEND